MINVDVIIRQFQGPTRLAEALTLASQEYVSRDAVKHWRRRGIPYKWVPWVAKISGYPEHQIREGLPRRELLPQAPVQPMPSAALLARDP
jgi:hypothetical protein